MKRKARAIIPVSVAALVPLTVWLWPRPKALYAVRLLPGFDSPFVLPLAINDHGQIAGYFQAKAA
jgi:hypothetical protein